MGLCWDLRGSALLQYWKMTIPMVLLVSSTLSQGSGAPWIIIFLGGGRGALVLATFPLPFDLKF